MSTKRVRYFSGQFLRQEDFTEEQDYLRSMRHRHNKEVHTFGVVEGLQVTPTGVAGEVEVENGWAIDYEGREIILASLEATKRTVSGDAPWYITCRYKETPTDEQPESVTGIEGHRRITEEADIEVVGAPLPTDVLVLAEITGTVASINVTDTRAFSGMKLAGKLISSHDSGILEIGSSTNVTGDLSVTGNLEVQGSTTIVANEQMQGNVTLGDEDSDTVTVEGTMGTGHSSGNLEITSPVNVTGGLDVSGAAQVGGDLMVQGNLQVQGETTLVQADQMEGNVILGNEDGDTVTVEGTMATGHSSGNLEITSPVNVTGGLNVSGTARLNGNVLANGRDLSVDGANLDDHLAINSGNPGNPHGITPEMIGAMPASVVDIGEGQFVSVNFSNLQANGAVRTVTLGFKPQLLWTTANMQAVFATSGGSRWLGVNSSGFADLRGLTFQQKCTYPLFEKVPYSPYATQRNSNTSHLCYASFRDSTTSTSIKEMAFGITITSVVASGSNWNVTFTFRRSPPSTTQYNISPFTNFSTSMQVWCLSS